MKNVLKTKAILRIVGIITMIAIIGFSMAACGGDNDTGGITGGNTGGTEGPGGGGGGGGTFTVTGIPSTYNGKYVDCSGVQLSPNVVIGHYDAYADYQIANGKVTIPMGTGSINPSTGKNTKYSGNDTLQMLMLIYNDADFDEDAGEVIWTSVKFTNGSATVTWDSKTYGP